jgi:PST family polysaccharide transporter
MTGRTALRRGVSCTELYLSTSAAAKCLHNRCIGPSGSGPASRLLAYVRIKSVARAKQRGGDGSGGLFLRALHKVFISLSTTLVSSNLPSPAEASGTDILCVMRMPPALGGHGGSQRAWHLVEALRPHGRIHFVLVYRDVDRDCVDTLLDDLASRVDSITRINIPGWNPRRAKLFGLFHPDFFNLARMRSQEAPRLSRRQLQAIAAKLPVRTPDIVFAGRLCSACIMQSLIDAGLLSAPLRVVDFDDIMSKFRLRQISAEGASMGRQWRALAPLDAQLIARAEQRIAQNWHAVSVCTDEDVAILQEEHPDTPIVKVPNVLERDALPLRAADGRTNLLFVGNLGFGPNVSGLQTFIEQAWPRVQQAVPDTKLTIVGLNPTADFIAFAAQHGLAVHANAPSLRPYYEQADIIIVPILFGSGTRIKILEAMAYGRPVVSTTIGAEGMSLEHRQHLMLAGNMAEFADHIIELARNPQAAQHMADRARAYQQAHYRPAAIHAAVGSLIAAGRAKTGGQVLSAARGLQSGSPGGDMEHSKLKGAAVNGVAASMLAQLLLFGLRFGYQIAIARLLLPSDFGLVAMITPVLGFVQLFADLGLSQATIQMKDISQGQLSFLFWLNVAAGFLLAALCVATAPLVASFYGDPRVSGVMAASAAMFAIGGFFSQHLALLNRHMRFRTLAAINLITFVVGAVFGIGAAAMGASYWSIVINQVASSVTTLVLAWSLSRWLPGRPGSLAQFRPLMEFGTNTTGFNIVNFFSRNSANILLGRYAGELPLGFYDRATKLMLVPFQQVCAPFSSVALPLLSRTQAQPALYAQAYERMLETMLVLTYPCLAFMIVNSHALAVLTLGQRWANVAPVFAILGIDMFVAPIGTSIGWLFVSQARTREMRNWGVVTSALFFMCFVIGLHWSVRGVAAGYALAGVIEICVLIPVVTRRGPIRTRDVLALLAPNLCAAAFAFAAVSAVKALELPTFLSLCLGLAAAYAGFGMALTILPRGRRMLREARRQAFGLVAAAGRA